MREPSLQDFGPFRIVRQLAVGGMAEIYLARQRGLEGVERTVVLKRILDRHADDPEFVTMFLDEARLLAALSHPNIAQVFDVGKVGATFYLVMEHVRGPTLGRLLSAARRSAARGTGEPGLPRREALGVGLAIAEALHYTHERRDELGRPLDIVHRDLNPANVIVSYDGAVKLIDFGIAKAATKVYETRSGVIKGTYGYIAPEQLVGSPAVDRRADVFALGILLYEMCVGVHPYDASDEPDLVDRILQARYRRPRQVRPDIPVDLDRLIASCLAPHPEGRPRDMAALIEGLAAHLGEQRMVPTQTCLAALARSLVPDDEGPRPLPRLAVERRAQGREPSGTVKVSLGRPDAARPSRPSARMSMDPLEEGEPLTLSTPDHGDLDEVTAAGAGPSSAVLDDDGEEDDDEAPTRRVSLPPGLGASAVARPPRTEREPTALAPPPRDRTSALVVIPLAVVGLVGAFAAAFFTVRGLSHDPPAPDSPRLEAPPAPPPAEPPAEPTRAPSPEPTPAAEPVGGPVAVDEPTEPVDEPTDEPVDEPTAEDGASSPATTAVEEPAPERPSRRRRRRRR